MNEVKFELFKPYELKIAFQRMPLPLQNRAAVRGRVERDFAEWKARQKASPAETLPPTAASINAKKALKFDLIAALLAKQGVSDKEFLDTIKQILAM